MDERDEVADMCRKIHSAGIRSIDAMTSQMNAHRRKRSRSNVPARMFVLCARCQTMLDLVGHAMGNMHTCGCGANIIVDPIKPPMLCFFSRDTDTGTGAAGVGVSPAEQSCD